jgi:hypothetical protein
MRWRRNMIKSEHAVLVVTLFLVLVSFCTAANTEHVNENETLFSNI